MRTKTQYKRDNYYLNLCKEVCVFTMMAYSFFNQAMMESFGPMIAMLAILFMFIPRVVINDLLDKDEPNGTREIKTRVIPEWKRNLNIALNITKFVSLIMLSLYVFMNQTMMSVFGYGFLWMISCFMVIPRKLINIMATESKKFEETLN